MRTVLVGTEADLLDALEKVCHYRFFPRHRQIQE
jgi:hypothetical protein